MSAAQAPRSESPVLDSDDERLAAHDRPHAFASCGVVLGLGLAVAVAYRLTKAPLYNPVATIDPWLYTALWSNFHQIYPVFRSTYYASRVPWIAPGFALTSLFGLKAAFWVIHTTLFVGGGLLLFFLARRRLGIAAAGIAYVTLLGSQMYYDAHRWDYEEGGVVFLIIATVACASWAPSSERMKALAAFLTGFCAAALAATRVLDVIYLLGGSALYWAVRAPLSRVAWRDRLLRDLVAFIAGAVVLLGLCGWFAKAYGGPFFFFMPQVRVLESGSGEGNHLPLHLWLPSMPSAFVPFAVIGVGLLGLAAGRHRPLPPAVRRFQIAATIWLGVSLAIVTVWEATGQGFVFELDYYFSSLLPPMVLCLASALPGFVGPMRPRLAAVSVAAGTLASLGPLLWLYGGDRVSRFPTHYTSPPYLVALGAMAVALLVAIAAALRRNVLIGVAAVVLAALATSYGLDSNSSTYLDGKSDPNTGNLYDMGQQLVGFLSNRTYGGATTLPYFWYRYSTPAVTPGAWPPGVVFGTLQSLYYYSYTYVGLAMPEMDADFRNRMHIYRPHHLVLLCLHPECGGAAEALHRAGYRPKLEAKTRLADGPLVMWVEIYRLRNPPR